MMSVSRPRRSAIITVEMVRFAVEELQMRRANVTAAMIAQFLRRRYAVHKNVEALKNELKDKLDYAVSRGIVSRCDMDTYCIPTFRQKAYNYKTDLTSFWERHYKKRPGRRMQPPLTKHKIDTTKNNNNDDSSDYLSDSDDDDDDDDDD